MIAATSAALSATSLFSAGLSKLGQFRVSGTDKNDSKGLSLAEFAEHIQGGKNLPGASKDAAGSATPSEETKAKFAKIDTDGDGKLSPDELNAHNKQLVQQLQSAMIKLQQMLGQDQDEDEDPSLAKKFASIDTDSDKSISKDELKAFFAEKSGDAESASAHVDKLFAKADTDKNGKLSKDELTAFEETSRKKKAQSTQDKDPIATLLEALSQAHTSQGQGGRKNQAAALFAANAYRVAH